MDKPLRVEAAPQLPLARRSPAPLALSVCTGATWLSKALEDMEASKQVTIASYMYDHPRVQDLLTKKLRAQHAPFTLVVVVDHAAYKSGVPRLQRPRLQSLRGLGALVYLANGRRGKGSFHLKAIVLDSKVAFIGTASATLASETNHELMLRVTGPAVQDIEADINTAVVRASVL